MKKRFIAVKPLELTNDEKSFVKSVICKTLEESGFKNYTITNDNTSNPYYTFYQIKMMFDDVELRSPNKDTYKPEYINVCINKHKGCYMSDTDLINNVSIELNDIAFSCRTLLMGTERKYRSRYSLSEQAITLSIGDFVNEIGGTNLVNDLKDIIEFYRYSPKNKGAKLK